MRSARALFPYSVFRTSVCMATTRPEHADPETREADRPIIRYYQYLLCTICHQHRPRRPPAGERKQAFQDQSTVPSLYRVSLQSADVTHGHSIITSNIHTAWRVAPRPPFRFSTPTLVRGNSLTPHTQFILDRTVIYTAGGARVSTTGQALSANRVAYAPTSFI
jgi:hypothetical protein